MKLPQIILVLVAFVIGVFLYFVPISPLVKEAEAEQTPPADDVSYNILDDINEIKNNLDSASLALISSQEIVARSEDAAKMVVAEDSLMMLFDMLRKPIGSAYHALKKAELTDNVDHWTEAGERFLLNAKYMGNETQRKSWFNQSKTSFEKALALAPEDLDIKVDLGVCLIEGAALLGTPPMEGIGMLKTVEQLDPDNIKVLVNLGYFAIRSGQFEKAEERFNRVLEIDAGYVDAYLYLADMHEKQKKFDLAIADLKNYKSKTTDLTKIKELDAYIEDLKKKKNI